jgi:hypothetical protein
LRLPVEFAAIGEFSTTTSSRVVSINRCQNLLHLGGLDPRRYNAPLDARSISVSTEQPIGEWMWGGTDEAQSMTTCARAIQNCRQWNSL